MFISEKILRVLESEPFIIVISGVLIFAIQQVLLEFWIKPVKEFKSVISKIEVLILRYEYFTSVTLGLTDHLDKEIWFFKNNLRKLTGELSANYRNLPTLLQIWIKVVRGIDVMKAKKELIGVSNLIASPSDVQKPEPQASKMLTVAKQSLKL